MNRILGLGAALFLSALAVGELTAQATPPIPAPPPGSAGIFRSGADLRAELDAATPVAGLSSSTITVTDQYRGTLVHRTEPNPPIMHQGNVELHYVVEGSGTVVTGGTVIRDAGVPARVEGGTARKVGKGDVVIIPPGSPHMYSQIDGSITYLEWRWVAAD